MSQDGLYDHIAHLDCLPQSDDFDGNEENGGVPCEGNGRRLLTESPSPIDETLKQMHERIQAEQRSAYAAKANRESVKLLIAAMEPLKP